MDDPNVLKSLNSKPNKDNYKMKEFKFFKAPDETPNVNNNEVQKEDFCALLDELIVYGSNNGWWSRTIDLMKQLKQKYD